MLTRKEEEVAKVSRGGAVGPKERESSPVQTRWKAGGQRTAHRRELVIRVNLHFPLHKFFLSRGEPQRGCRRLGRASRGC